MNLLQYTFSHAFTLRKNSDLQIHVPFFLKLGLLLFFTNIIAVTALKLKSPTSKFIQLAWLQISAQISAQICDYTNQSKWLWIFIQHLMKI